MKDVIIRKSRIHGMGVFAARDFKKDEVILRWDTSESLTKNEVDRLPENERRYIAHSNGKYIMMQSPAKYVNHSCGSNTYTENFCDVAKIDITKGEEITTDYSEDASSGLKMKCNCNSKNCKRIVVI